MTNGLALSTTTGDSQKAYFDRQLSTLGIIIVVIVIIVVTKVPDA